MDSKQDSIPTKSLTKADWQRLSTEWEESDLSQQVFCKQKRIGFHAFSYWRNRLLKANRQDAGKTHFQSVTVTNRNVMPQKMLPTERTALALPNGITLYVPPGSPITQLAEILSLLGVACD